MRVGHLCSSFSPLSETFIYDYVIELENGRSDNQVLTFRRLNEAHRPFEKVTVLPMCPRWHPKRIWSRLLTEFRDVPPVANWAIHGPYLYQVLRESKVDVLHAHFGVQGVLAARVTQRLGIPLVVSFYGFDISSLPRDRRWREEYVRLWDEAHALVVLSEHMRQQVLALGCPASKVHILHLARDLSIFPFQPTRGPVRRFVSVGRLVEKKGHLDTIQAFEQLRDEQREPGILPELRIIGDGPLYGELRAYVVQRGLQDWVSLVGAIPNDQVIEELCEADAFILASKTAPDGDREGTPTVIIEAQAMGLPCISTLHAGIPEMIPSEHHHLLAEEGDVKGLAECIRTAMGYSSKQLCDLAEVGRAKINEEFNLTREADKLVELYGSLCCASENAG